MHKFAALLTHSLLMIIKILHLTLLAILVHQNFCCGFIILTVLILLSIFKKSLKTNQFLTTTNWLSFMEKIEQLGNKPRLWWNVHRIFFFVFWISCSFVFPCSIWGLHWRFTLCFANKFGLVYNKNIHRNRNHSNKWMIHIFF